MARWRGTRPGFVLEVSSPLTPDDLWARLWDLDRHSASIPLTTVTAADGRPLALGSLFTGRTALGPLGFDDVMEVTSWQRPTHATIEKIGRWLGGRITVDVEPRGTGSRLVWSQTYRTPLLPDRLAGLASGLVRHGYATSIRRIIG